VEIVWAIGGESNLRGGKKNADEGRRKEGEEEGRRDRYEWVDVSAVRLRGD
jgi:hypothetical protein